MSACQDPHAQGKRAMFNKTIFRIMAKSKNGGTRAYIRGRIGSDVYSIGKNGKGEKQQVVRSLAETVANPRTAAQMAGRMYMSTVMQAVSALSVIIDHSFDGFPKGQPCISEFIKQNYALIKADAKAHPASGNAFGLNKYQEKGIRSGAYVVSAGTVAVPAALSVSAADGEVTIALGAGSLTVSGLKAKLGFGEDDYLTIVGITSSGKVQYDRLRIDPTLADDTAITADNAGTLFLHEGNKVFESELATNNISIVATSIAYNIGVIITKNVDGAWKHSSCQLSTPTSPVSTSDVALPTYPTGNEQFLNGGDL